MFCNGRGVPDLLCRPLARTPVICHIQIANALREGLDDLSHRRTEVWPVGEDNVNVRLLQPLQAALQSLDHVLATQAPSIWFLTARSEVDLSGQHVFVPGPCQFLERNTQLSFGLSARIFFSGVEKVDAVAPCRLQAVLHRRPVYGLTNGEPCAQPDDRDFQS